MGNIKERYRGLRRLRLKVRKIKELNIVLLLFFPLVLIRQFKLILLGQVALRRIVII